MLKALATLLLSLANLSTACAADFLPTAMPNVAKLSGRIERGDAAKFAKLLSSDFRAFSLILASPGGDVQESIRIARLVREFQIQVSVEPRENCASACFFVYLAGSGRFAAGVELDQSQVNLGRVGLHRPYLAVPTESPESRNRQLAIMASVRKYLAQNQVPSSLIDQMMSRPSNSIYWLKTEELEQLGDFTPDFEELYVAKCNYDRKLNNHIVMARYVMDRPTEQRLLATHKKVMTCIVDMQLDAYFLAKQKVLKGWVPKADM